MNERRYFMGHTNQPCFKCGKKGKDYDTSWPGAKYCPNCGIHFCSNCGYGKEQCPKCGKYSLK